MSDRSENRETDCEITVYDGAHSTCEMNVIEEKPDLP
jgi:hypothetical protein